MSAESDSVHVIQDRKKVLSTPHPKKSDSTSQLKKERKKPHIGSSPNVVQVLSVDDLLFTLLKISIMVLFFSIIMMLQIIGGPH